MGQKVNPIGIRLKINRTWDSVWFARFVVIEPALGGFIVIDRPSLHHFRFTLGTSVCRDVDELSCSYSANSFHEHVTANWVYFHSQLFCPVSGSM